MNDNQACVSVKYFHVIASQFLQLAKDDFIKVGVIENLVKHGMMNLLGLTCTQPGRKMSVHSRVAYTKERSSSSQKGSICQKFPREYSFCLRLNYCVFGVKK